MAGVDILATAFNGSNAAFIADLYARWVENPNSVDASFADLFATLNDESRAVIGDAAGASWSPRDYATDDAETARTAPERRGYDGVRAATLDSIRALMMVRVYRVRGHLEAQLDPLGLQKPKSHPELDPRSYGFTHSDWDRPIFIDRVLGREAEMRREQTEYSRLKSEQPNWP